MGIIDGIPIPSNAFLGIRELSCGTTATLTRNYLDVKMSMTRAIAQLGRAPRLHARQCFFREVHHTINQLDLI